MGGLVRAYGTAAAALDHAVVVDYEPQVRVRLIVEYTDADRVQRAIEEVGAVVESAEYEQSVIFTVSIAETAVERLGQTLAEATAGRGVIESV